jgi:hypothetical protein
VTEAGKAVAANAVDLAEAQVLGLAVVTQTCDVVRSCAEREYIEVCPLVEVNDIELRQVVRGHRPRYGYVPLLADRRLVADLDRVMTVEKPVLAKWDRIAGWSTDAQARAFAMSLARKRARFAFPDDFTALATRLQARLLDKHDRQSPEGRALRALREIRVHAAPSWADPAVTLTFWFVKHDEDSEFQGVNWSTSLAEWMKLLPEGGTLH